MKKTLLSAAAFAVVAVSAVSIAPTTSEAIPAFARQTGAACLSCHFQSFPALNAFGRAFKLGAFTDVGEQALIEDDNFSLPAVLNLGMVLRPQFISSKAPGGAVTSGWAVPADSNILLAGRVGSNTGAFVEFNAGAGNFQLMNSIDFDTFKAGLNIAATSFGPTAGLEFLSVYGQHGGKLFGADVSAMNNIIAAPVQGHANPADTAIAAWASNDMFTLQVAAVVPGANLSGNANDGTGVSNASFVPMAALTYAGDVGAFDTLIEVGTMVGTATSAATGTTRPTSQGVDAKWIAAQVQGEVGDMSLGIYGDYVTTKAKSVPDAITGAGTTTTNLYGTSGKVSGYSIRAEIEPINQLLFGLGYGNKKDDAAGVMVGTVAGTETTTYTHYAVTYEIYQNMELTISKTDTNVTNSAAATNGRTKSTLVELEGVF